MASDQSSKRVFLTLLIGVGIGGVLFVSGALMGLETPTTSDDLIGLAFGILGVVITLYVIYLVFNEEV